jgi:hypothetical protein
MNWNLRKKKSKKYIYMFPDVDKAITEVEDAIANLSTKIDTACEKFALLDTWECQEDDEITRIYRFASTLSDAAQFLRQQPIRWYQLLLDWECRE